MGQFSGVSVLPDVCYDELSNRRVQSMIREADYLEWARR